VVVLDELAVVDEILAEIEHFLDAVPDLLRASSGSSIRRTSPFASRTVGPSMESTGMTPWAFPGRSVLIWVPAARKSSTRCMVAGGPRRSRTRGCARDRIEVGIHPPHSGG